MKYNYRVCETNSRWTCFVSDIVASKHGILLLTLGLTWFALFGVEAWYRSSFTSERMVISLEGPISILVLLLVASVLFGLSQIIRDRRNTISRQPDCFAYDVEVDELGVQLVYSNCLSRFEWKGLHAWKLRNNDIELVFDIDRIFLRREKISPGDFSDTISFLKRKLNTEPNEHPKLQG